MEDTNHAKGAAHQNDRCCQAARSKSRTLSFRRGSPLTWSCVNCQCRYTITRIFALRMEGERVLPTRYRSLASAMRTVKQVGDTLTFDGVPRTDFTVNVEPCGDRWSDCGYQREKQ